jgi:hypothetical protein
MEKLSDKLPLPDRRKEIVDACARILDDEVKKKKGIGGLAVKTAYKVLKALKPGAVQNMVDALFDDFIEALDRFHVDYQGAGYSGSFGGYIQTRDSEVAEALVQVTDRRAEQTKHNSLRKGYQKLRKSAMRNVQESVPGLGDLMDRYYRNTATVV